MTITSVVAITGHLPGDASNFTFDFGPINIFANDELRVYHVVTATGVETLLEEGAGASNYSVSSITFPGTGSITYPATETNPIPSTETIIIKRVITLDQQTKLKAQGGYLPSTHEQQYDKFVVMIQDLQEQLDRCLKIPISDSLITNTEVSPSALRTAGHVVQVDDAGTGFSTAGISAGTDATASSATPAAVSVSAGSAGSGTDFSRQDHVHLLPTTVPRLATENIWTETQVLQKGADITSAASITIPAGNISDVTGVATITSLVSVGIGTKITLHFDGVLTLTHHATNLVCPGGEDIITQAGMEVELYEYASADWRVVAVNAQVPVRLQQSVDLSQKITFEDDFLGTISTPIESTSSGGTIAAVSAGKGGRITMVSNNTVTSHAADAVVLNLDTLDWTADQGGLTFEVRLQIDDITSVAFFVGFTDVLGSTTVEMPVFKTSGADTLDSDATDAAGVGFDTQGTTDEFWHGGVKANTDTAAQHSGSAPVNGTYVTIRVEISAAGVVEGFINGTSIGAAVAAAITVTTALTPVIALVNRTTSARTMIADYVSVQANR